MQTSLPNVSCLGFLVRSASKKKKSKRFSSEISKQAVLMFLVLWVQSDEWIAHQLPDSFGQPEIALFSE